MYVTVSDVPLNIIKYKYEKIKPTLSPRESQIEFVKQEMGQFLACEYRKKKLKLHDLTRASGLEKT